MLPEHFRLQVFTRLPDIPQDLYIQLRKLTYGTAGSMLRTADYLRAYPGYWNDKKLAHDNVVVVAFVAGTPVGWILLDYRKLVMMYVDDTYRRCGIASMMLAEMYRQVGKVEGYTYMPGVFAVMANASLQLIA